MDEYQTEDQNNEPELKIALHFATPMMCVDNVLAPEEFAKVLKSANALEVTKTPTEWNGVCSSTYQKHQFLPNVFNPVIKAFEDYGNRFLEELKYDGSVQIKNNWLNKYEKGSYQEWHLHANMFFSGIYIVDAEYAEDVILFENPSIGELMNTPPHVAESTIANELITDVYSQTNRLIIFKSYLKHMVPKTNGKRITISANMNVK